MAFYSDRYIPVHKIITKYDRRLKVQIHTFPDHANMLGWNQSFIPVTNPPPAVRYKTVIWGSTAQ
jgi:hypothetical protein